MSETGIFYKITGTSDLPIRIMSNPYKYFVHYGDPKEDATEQSNQGGGFSFAEALSSKRRRRRFIHNVDGYCEACRLGDPKEKYYVVIYSYKDRAIKVLDASPFFLQKIKTQIEVAKKKYPDLPIEDFLFNLRRESSKAEHIPWVYRAAFEKQQACPPNIQEDFDSFLEKFSIEDLCYPTDEELDYLDEDIINRIEAKPW